MNLRYRVDVAFDTQLTGYWRLGYSQLGIDTTLGGGHGGGAVFRQIEGVKVIAISRGRNAELDAVEAGTMDVLLENEDQRFTPLYSKSGYYPNVQPLKQIRAVAVINGVDYPLYRGFVTNWQPSRAQQECVVQAVDGFHWLESYQLSSYNPGALLSGARITAVLNATKWDSSMTDVDTGKDTITSGVVDKSALQDVQDTAAGERGLFLVSADGKMTYQDRNHRSTSSAPVLTLYGGDNGDIEACEPDYGFEHIYNRILDSAGTVLAQDATVGGSQDTYGVHDYTIPDYVPTAQKTVYAAYVLSQYKDPHMRLKVLISPLNDAQAIAYLGLDISSRIHVMYSDLEIDADFWVERIEHGITNNLTDHGIVLTLGYVDHRDFWILGVSSLGVSTSLGY